MTYIARINQHISEFSKHLNLSFRGKFPFCNEIYVNVFSIEHNIVPKTKYFLLRFHRITSCPGENNLLLEKV